MTKTLTKILYAVLLALPVTQFSTAEITGSGIQFANCGGQFDFQLWLDTDNDGIKDSDEPGLPNVEIELSRSDAAYLGVAVLTSDASGAVMIDYLCSGEYSMFVNADSVPPGTQLRSAFDTGEALPVSGSNFNLTLSKTDTQYRFVDVLFEQAECELDVVASCATPSVQNGDVDDYDCEKPVSEISVVWNGDSPVRVVAHAGKLDKPVMADFDHVAPGQLITLAGLEGTGNDLIWEIYEAGTDVKLGESNFHLSCSDYDMDGAEDCGAAAGDGKYDDKCTGGSCINDWLFAGLIDKHNEIQCLSDSGAVGAAECSLYPDTGYTVRYSVTNSGSEPASLTSVSESGSSISSESEQAIESGQQLDFVYFDETLESVVRRFDADFNVLGFGCSNDASVAVTVMDPPPACNSVVVETREVKHEKFKLRFTNPTDQDLLLTGYELSWPQENDKLSETKWDGQKLFDHDTAWQPLLIHSEEDFLLQPNYRALRAGDHIETEFKFKEHVHDGPQSYSVSFRFDSGCSIDYTVEP